MREKEEKKFIDMGIIDGVSFEIEELKGRYKIDIDDRVAIDITVSDGGLRSRSIYEHLLDGTWHKR